MSADRVSFTGPLQTWHGAKHGSMTFLAITGEAAEGIAAHELVRRLELGKRRGFGSVKVRVRTGESEWSTSVFPIGEEEWFLPVKAAIRKAEGLAEGKPVQVELDLL